MTLSSRALAATRISIGLGALLIALEKYVTLGKIADGRVRVPVFDWFPPISSGGTTVVLGSFVLFAVTLVAGFHTRVAAGGLTLVSAFILLWDQQAYSNHLFLLLCLSAYLTLGDPGAHWSLDARIRGGRPDRRQWAMLLIMTQISVLYFFTGIAKLNESFLSGDVLQSVMWLPIPEMLYVPLSVVAVATELFLAFALWARQLTLFAVGLGVFLHLSIIVMLDQPLVLLAFALLSVGTYPLFLARSSHVRAYEQRRGSAPRKTSLE